MKTETTYLIVTKKTYTIIEGWTGPQYRGLNVFRRTICWFIGLLVLSNHRYPRDDTPIQQYFPDLQIPESFRGVKIIKRGVDYERPHTRS